VPVLVAVVVPELEVEPAVVVDVVEPEPPVPPPLELQAVIVSRPEARKQRAMKRDMGGEHSPCLLRSKLESSELNLPRGFLWRSTPRLDSSKRFSDSNSR
jgi:hypothetical protein